MVRPHDRLLWFLAPLLAAQMVSPMRQPTPGDLDPSFGVAGKVTTHFAGPGELARAVVVQPDGKIVVGGRAGVGHQRDFALVRYNIDGTLDRTFGLRGRVRTDLGGRESVAALALQPDGRIVAAGTTTRPSSDFALARYDANGDLDATFGTGGIVRTEFAGGFDAANTLVIQPDGKLVVAGYAVAEDHVGFAVVRYRPDGTLDTAFGSGGKAFTVFSRWPGEVEAVALLPDGKILAAGFSSTASTFGGAFALARYNPDGTLDVSFGNGGKVRTDFASNVFAYALAMQADGKAVVAGRTGVGSDTDFALARYNSDGRLDETFGAGGRVRTDLAGHRDIAFAVVAQIDGGIVVAGRSGAGTTPDFALVRYTANGSLDASFGSDGKVTTDFAGQLDVAYACTLQPDGRIVAVGRTGLKPRTAFAAARYEGV